MGQGTRPGTGPCLALPQPDGSLAQVPQHDDDQDPAEYPPVHPCLPGERASAAAQHNPCMPHSRDPVSELLDRGARALLARAYSVRAGTWVMTRLADPSREHLDWAQDMGLDSLMGPDKPTTASGAHVQAHTRWGRAFMRALWYQHKWY